MKEIELFPALQEMYKDNEVFAEVPFRHKRPDVVVRNSEGITVIEMKTSLNKQLVEQAMYWYNSEYCNYVYVAVPAPKCLAKTLSGYAVELSDKGIGIIYVDTENNSAFIHRKAKRLWAPFGYAWKKALIDVFKDTIGGSQAKGGVMTRYKNMINQVKKYMLLVKVPVSAQDIVNGVPEVREHYSNPVPSIRTALSDYERDWCSRKFVGKRIYFTANIKRTPIAMEKES